MKRTVVCWAVTIFVLTFFLYSHALANQTEEVICEEETVSEEVFLFESKIDELDLAEGYINKQLFPMERSGLLRAHRLIGSRLNGVNRQVYLGLHEGILEVAAGLRESTVFSFSFEDLYEQRTFSAEELGVEAILIDGALPQETKDKARAMMAVPYYSVINQALLADCPYELYWFNKAEGGMKISTSRTYEATTNSIMVNGSITVSMTVSSEYAKGTYIIDTTYGQSASGAAVTAQGIVEEYSNYSGATKLRAYLDEICDRVAYNTEAGNGNVPYGNPWQLVWVFDNNPETKVTCEGYSKAFQYLCDLSSDDISVISVTGKMNGANHMWNIASMEDEKNYMIDVTNCDSGMAGFPDKLFLVGAKDGNVSDGYTFSVNYFNLTYQYESNTPFSNEELRIAYWDYEDGGPPTPEFQTLSTSLCENESIDFSFLNEGYAYDEFMVEIACLNEGSEAIQLTEEKIQLQADESTWSYDSGILDPGRYSFRFTGYRDGTASVWTAPIYVNVTDFGELIPTYRFSTEVGYTGYQVVVRLDQQAQGIYIQETQEEYPCQGQDVLLPMTEIGEREFSIALIWNGKVSAYGTTTTVTVLNALEGLPSLTIPDGMQHIEDEAFRGIGAVTVTIPDSVESIGEFTFADNGRLLWVEMGAPEIDETAFENCPNAVFHPSEIEWGFAHDVPFLQ